MQTVYDYIKSQESAYQTVPVPVVEGYEWLMFDHVKTTTLYLNSKTKYSKKEDEEDLPFGNIILPKIQLQHRATKIQVSELEFYIDSEDEDYKAFLVKKWHERWGLKNDLSTFLSRMTRTFTSYGGVLLENTPDALAVVPFQRLAFCDQTDMMSGPICQKHQYSPDQLKEMESRGWKNLDLVIALAQDEKANTQTAGGSAGLKAKTPGRYIDVYDLEGMLPESFLEGGTSDEKFTRQLQIVTFYTDKDGNKQGITLFEGKKAKSRYKAKKRDDDDDSTYGRALGRGGVEELFEPQVWYNYSLIQKTELLDNISKILYQTADQSFKNRNQTSDLKQGEVLTYASGQPLTPVNTTNAAPVVTVLDNALTQWDEAAKTIASARDAISGEASKSGMPFREVALLNQENHSLHQDRKEQLGNFLTSEVYPDWVIPKMVKDVSGGAEWLACLSLDEMGQIVDQVVSYEFNQTMIKKVFAGEIVWPEDAENLKQTYRQQFFKNNRKFLTILKGELADLPMEVVLNVTGDQKNMAMLSEKVAAIWTQATQILIVNPNFFTQHPEMAKLFNEVIKASGLSTLNFGMKGYLQPPQQGAAPTLPSPQLTPPQYAPRIPAQVPSQPQAG